MQFDHADGGLVSKDGKTLTWFASMAGKDGQFFQPADAKIVGDTVEVSNPRIDRPAAVRSAWAETAQPNFFNGAGLPADAILGRLMSRADKGDD